MTSAILQIRCLDPLLTEEAWQSIASRLELSEREFQIVRLVFEDEHEREIAAILGISLHTVHTHLKNLHRKLCVRSRVGLVLRVVREYLATDKLADAEEHRAEMPSLTLRSERRAA